MQPQRIPLKTTVTAEDLDNMSRCERLFEIGRTQARQAYRPPEQKAAIAAGNAYHRAASAHVSIRDAIIEEELSAIPVEARAQVRVEITEMVNGADSAATTEDAGLRREVQLLWQDPVTGWTFASKPDLFGALDVIYIKEDKRAKRFYESHKFQVWFAAFVAAQIDLESQAHLPPEERKQRQIEMTVRCSRFIPGHAGQKRRMWIRTFRFPVERLERETEFMRKQIQNIERRHRANYFRPKLEFTACSTCPRRSECAALLRNGPLLEKLRAEEVRMGRETVFPIVVAQPHLPTQQQPSVSA